MRELLKSRDSRDVPSRSALLGAVSGPDSCDHGRSFVGELTSNGRMVGSGNSYDGKRRKEGLSRREEKGKREKRRKERKKKERKIKMCSSFAQFENSSLSLLRILKLQLRFREMFGRIFYF